MEHPKTSPKNHKTSIGGVLLLFGVVLSLLLPTHGEETLKEITDPSLKDLNSKLVLISCQVDGKAKRGKGIIVEMNGTPYLLTSQHILLGASKVGFITADGERLSPTRVELATDRDLIRLALKEGLGLPFTTHARMDTTVFIPIDCNDENPRFERGNIIGVGGTKIEISIQFDESNSGAPVINKKSELIGIASYSRESTPHAMKKGTRFEETTRYFCNRIGKSKWQPVNWRSYNRKFGMAYQKHQVFADQILDILKNGENFNASSEKAADLASQCRTQARQLRVLCQQSDLTGFLLNDFEGKIELFEVAEELLCDYANRKR